MSERLPTPSPQQIAQRMRAGETITPHLMLRDYKVGQIAAEQIIERAKEIQTGWMLMKFARPRAIEVSA